MDMPLHEGYAVAAQSRTDIRAAALHARNVLGLRSGRLDISNLLDRLTEFGLYYDVFDRDTSPVPIEVEAYYVPEDRTIYIRDSVHKEMCNGGQRAVFTLGHELGHALLAHRHTYNRKSAKDLPAYCNSEWQANTFAAEFTMPIDQIKAHGLNAPKLISNHFGVSMAAASIRQKTLMSGGGQRKNP